MTDIPQRVHPGYLARNLDVATAKGLNAGLCKTLSRMKRRKDCPLWLIEALQDYIDRSNTMIRVTVEHRNELPKHMSPNSEGNAPHDRD